MKKEDRQEKEKKYEETNKESLSVCCGFHYIKQTHKHEKCKKCDMCYKYFLYKNNKTGSFTEVRHHYVESFRECDLWGQKVDIEKPKVEPKPKRIEVQKPMKAIDVYRQGYENIVNNYPQLLDFVTWNELYAICAMKRAVEQMDDAIRQSDLFKMEFKKVYNRFYQKYKLYISEVYKRCFNGDAFIVEKEAESLNVDLFKFRLTIENYLNKFKVKHAKDMSYVVMCVEMIDEVEILFRLNMALLHKADKRAAIASFMSPKELMMPIMYVVRNHIKIDNVKDTIDLRKDFNVKNGIKVIHNKLIDKRKIKEIIKKLDDFYIKNHKQ